jgi:hypothetical protein
MPKSILDPTFRYTSSANTDIRKTFARARREQRRAEVDAQASKTEAKAEPVKPIPFDRPRRTKA